MKRFTLILVIRFTLAVVLAPWAASADGLAAEVITPHPLIERTASPVTKQLGDFGESFVDAGLRARGFQVVDGNIGVNGIDRIAVKRTGGGELVDIRFVEVKTRQSIPEFKLAVTHDGPQLSEGWTRPQLERILREHPNVNTRRFAGEILEAMKTRPEIVRRELHGLAVESNKYVVMSVDEAGRVTGVAAEGRLTSLLKMLSTRGTSEETRTIALRHLSQFDQLQAAVATAAPESLPAAKAGVRGLQALAKQAELPTVREIMTPATAAIVEDIEAAKGWASTLARQPGVLAAGITFAVDETFTGWEYHKGNLSSADFHRRSAENGAKAVAVGIATQLVYILAPTPSGLVLIGVAIVAYVVAEQAITAYNNAFVPKAPVRPN